MESGHVNLCRGSESSADSGHGQVEALTSRQAPLGIMLTNMIQL